MRFTAIVRIALLAMLGLSAPAWAQSAAPDAATETSLTMFPHATHGRWWVGGQGNFIFQAHPDFAAKYSGPNSLQPQGETAVSRLLTLFVGLRLRQNTEVVIAVEEAGGSGISDALGLGGITNVDVVRNPTLSKAPYLARAMIRQVIPLSSRMTDGGRGSLSVADQLPERRIEVRFGKFGMADFFDPNGVGSDSHYQFTNWTVVNNGAYDYAADTRGYTVGFMATYFSPKWTVRYAEALMPKVANGPDLDYNPTRARAENVEVEAHREPWHGHATTVRMLGYVNHANMGDYREAVRQYLNGTVSKPDVTLTRQQGRVKYGFGLNLEQELTPDLRAFGRWGWNEGRNELFAYTEVNETTAFGADYAGRRWHRTHDKLGAAFVSNGLSKDHQNYLHYGGVGFLLGDGGLSYGRENILETYYNAHLWRGVFGAAGVQRIWNPGYNHDRGPVIVPMLRMHFEF